MLYLNRKTVEALGITMRQVLQVVEEGFRLKGLGQTEMPAKMGIHTNEDAFIHAMPAYVKGVEAAGLKWVAGYPSNPAKGLPYISGLLILNDAKTGLPLAVMDCSWITAMRTGASTGISAKYLADPKSSRAGFLGCGVQARTSLMALVEVLPALAEIYCNDLFPKATDHFIADMSKLFPKLKFVKCVHPRQIVEEMDVVTTAIPIVKKPQPPLDANMLKPGALAVSLDYDSAWTSAAMKQCRFYSDDITQLTQTKHHGVYFGGIPDKIDADLGELTAGLKPGRESSDSRYFSMNMGIAVDDMVTARIIHQRAIEKSAGITLEL